MKKLKLLLILPFLLALSCSNEDEEIQFVEESPKQKTPKQEQQAINFKALYSKHHTISKKEAEQMAIAIRNLPCKNEQGLKSAKNASIKDVKVISRGNGLKSTIQGVDTLVYIVNFDNDEGFTIIAADDRVSKPVIAYIQSGRYDEEYIKENIPALADLIENSYNHIRYEISVFESKKDSLRAVADSILRSGVFPKIENNLKAYVTGTRYVYIGEYESPILLQTVWDQSTSPYNDSVPVCPTTGSRVPAGCMATAVAQVMAYWKYPSSIYGHSFDWVGMTEVPNAYFLTDNNDKKDVSYLFKLIGLNTQMNYGCNESGTTWPNTRPWLEYVLGYNVADFDYSWLSVYNYLSLNTPVIITAKDVLADGHAWVLDGYQSVFYNEENYILNTDNGVYVVTSSTPIMINYIHNNWGWGGFYNGFFQADFFCTLLPRDGVYDNGYSGTLYFNFTENKKIHILYR